MDLPVKFPTETEVILEDVARFRALSPEERMVYFRTFLRDAETARRNSPNAEIQKYIDEQAELKRRNILEFLARHGCGPDDSA